MRISRSTGYGILAVAYIAKNSDQGPIVSQDISKKYNIPLEYLLKIMQQLVRGGILKSKRGPKGGFSLRKSVDKINFLEVVEAIEGPTQEEIGMSEFISDRNPLCKKVESIYKESVTASTDILSKIKVSELIS